MPRLYSPIYPYQTRLLHIPKRTGNNKGNELLECTLHVADILHEDFGGFALRASNGDSDQLVKFDALSYVWGPPEKTSSIICNGQVVGITRNLCDALHRIQARQNGNVYVWADAICINQEDDIEKAVQVASMFKIYRQASAVLAWLGEPSEASREDIQAAIELSFFPEENSQCDLQKTTRGAESLYATEWFRRMWVQQEVYAAKAVRFLFGDLEFSYCPLLAEPEELFPYLPMPTTFENSGIDRWFLGIGRKESPISQMETLEKARVLQGLYEHADAHLYAYRIFSRRKPVDLVEALLGTRHTKVTNPLDRVYGVLGVSRFPARAMSISEWCKADQPHFIPIDYNATVAELLSAVTKVLLWKLGFGFLVKFKVFALKPGDSNAVHPLPSWAVDWELTLRLITHIGDSGSYFDRNLKVLGPWGNLGGVTKKEIERRQSAVLARVRQNNIRAINDDVLELTIPGHIVGTTIVARDNSANVIVSAHTISKWSDSKETLESLEWDDVEGVEEHDIIVLIPGYCLYEPQDCQFCNSEDCVFYGEARIEEGDHFRPHGAALWALRPSGQDRFKLIRCLLNQTLENGTPYPQWSVDRNALQEDQNGLLPLSTGSNEIIRRHRAGMVFDTETKVDPRHLGELLTFRIV